MRMRTRVMNDTGLEEALYGLGLSYGLTGYGLETSRDTINRLMARAKQLVGKGLGHDKFMESIVLHIDVIAPLYWWAEADTYRLSTKQSASTMHTINKEISAIPNDACVPLFVENNFCYESEEEKIVIQQTVRHIIWALKGKEDNAERTQIIKRLLPCSFMQERVWCMSLKTFGNILMQRQHHLLPEWKKFICNVLLQSDTAQRFLGKFYTGDKKNG